MTFGALLITVKPLCPSLVERAANTPLIITIALMTRRIALFPVLPAPRTAAAPCCVRLQWAVASAA
jgi:hypothetical protein